jgi:predicted nuclease of restriction endonuclease-like (RecB) superfamily
MVDNIVPGGYATVLAEVKREIHAARTRAALAVNSELIGLYWRIGHRIVELQDAEGPRTKVVDRLSADLRADFPAVKGLGRSNLNYMRAFALAWPDEPSFQRLVGKMPWGHNIELLDRLNDREVRSWYARHAIEHGWSRAVLIHQIMSKLHLRAGAASSNFAAVMPAAESELMQQVTKDPYNFEFLGISAEIAERELEEALLAHVQRFLLELGQGFAFVGRQYSLVVGEQDFFIDLLFFHIPTKRYVVLELKRTGFTPEAIGKLNFYVNVIDDRLRSDGENATIGLLLCTSRDEHVVRYSLSGVSTPLAVAGYTLGELPAEVRDAVPAEAGLIHTVEAAIDEYTHRGT